MVYNISCISPQLQTLQKRLECGSSERVSEINCFPELLAHLSTPSPHTLDQVKALTIATEAFRGKCMSCLDIATQLSCSFCLYNSVYILNAL